MARFSIHHQKADIHMIYAHGLEWGKGIIQLENYFKIATVGL